MAKKRDEMTAPDALQILFAKAKQVIESKGIIPIKIVSASMDPVIKVNEKVIVAKPNRPIARFDIIVFMGDRELICHYVRHVNRFVNAGDNNLIRTRGLTAKQDDIPVHQDHILGLVISHRLNLWRKIRLMWAIR